MCIGRSRRARHMEQRALKNPESNVNVKIHTCPEVAFRIEHKSDAHYVSWKFSPGHSLPWETGRCAKLFHEDNDVSLA